MRRDTLDGVAGAIAGVVILAIVGLDVLTGGVIVWEDDRHNDASREQPHRCQVGKQAEETQG